MGRRDNNSGPVLPVFSFPRVDGGIGPGVAYSILAGIGAVGTVVAGKLLYKDSVTAKMVLFLTLIIVGVIGIRVTSGGA